MFEPFLTKAEQNEGLWLGRLWLSAVQGPAVVTLRNGEVFDITSAEAPTVSHVCELPDPVAFLRSKEGAKIGNVEDLCRAPVDDFTQDHFLAPNDLQAVKACGVTFAGSMVERVIEERAAGDPAKAESLRHTLAQSIGDSLRNIVPGSEQAEQVKAALQANGLWSQYLEVGIGPDAEVFSKAQVLSAVGPGATVGLHPVSTWNNPEPEIVLAVNSKGQPVGATLGNDVNLRDVEGRSALLLSKAKDNNASAAIGPMIRLFDGRFSMDHVRQASLKLSVAGEDGFLMEGQSLMSEISRDPLDLVAQTIGAHHQYPDGFMIYLGTLFAPIQDRDVPGQGFTHKVGDQVTISSQGLGVLANRVDLSTACPPWTFGISSLMRNLASRGLL